jgi:hypothetical protein
MSKNKERAKGLTRGATVALKATRIAETLRQAQETPAPTESIASGDDDDSAITEQVAVDSETPTADCVVTPSILKAEIQQLRRQLLEKTTAYRSLVGNSPERESKVVAAVVAMLSETSGATKTALVEKTGAKKGYIDALLNRILPARGIEISSAPIDGGRVRSYRIVSGPASEE